VIYTRRHRRAKTARNGNRHQHKNRE
jgi:hypothetical protein